MSEVMDNMPAFIDASFEHTCRSVDRQVQILVKAVSTGNASAMRREVERLCKAIRHARLEFEQIVTSYGLDYEDQASRFIDLVERAANVAADVDHPKVVASIRSHADYVATRQVEMKADQ